MTAKKSTAVVNKKSNIVVDPNATVKESIYNWVDLPESGVRVRMKNVKEGWEGYGHYSDFDDCWYLEIYGGTAGCVPTHIAVI